MRDRQTNPKRTINLLISAGFYFVAGVWEFMSRLLGRKRGGRCVILYYHSIKGEYREKFARQMDILVRLAKPLRADAQRPLNNGVRYVIVTFDDGFQNIIENALPELSKRSIPSTIFVVTEGLGKCLDWSEEFYDCYRQERIVTEDQLRQLSPDLVTIGSHTMTHPNLPAIEENAAKREIAQSRRNLEMILQRQVTLLSFPHGAFNEKLIMLCREAGYERVFTTLPHLALSDPKEFVSGRIGVEPTDWPWEFRLKLLGAYRWQPMAFSVKQRILSIPKALATGVGHPRPANRPS
jgi:peptidoglycan/xylan/chitin deacetylase (PgdA/CDA1 family)